MKSSFPLSKLSTYNTLKIHLNLITFQNAANADYSDIYIPQHHNTPTQTGFISIIDINFNSKYKKKISRP